MNDSLGDRMKLYYESIPKTRLMRRCPVALRLDGRHFHSFTRGFNRPFDEVLATAMNRTMEYLCQNIQNCICGYVQSDEITLILIDYQTFETDAWFDYEVQKLCSIGASMATMVFNKFFQEEYDTWASIYANPFNGVGTGADMAPKAAYLKAIEKGAMFDCRCFNIPKEEATNLIYWRQLDCRRNSIQMAGQAVFSHQELQGKNQQDIIDMLLEKGISWEECPMRFKYGALWTKTHGLMNEIPMLKGDDREIVEKEIWVGEE